jgi:pSer/pThr/pTyr-binding forkhead associated (FHA) protein
MGIRLILEEQGQETEFNFDLTSVTIGRTADNTIRIKSTTSSRQHCRISKTPNGYLVEDLKSRNGTMLNGEDIHKRVLAIGDRIEIGSSIIHFSARLEGGSEEEVPVKAAPKSDRQKRAPRRSNRIKRSARRKDAKREAVPEPGRYLLEFLNPPGDPTSIEQLPFMIGNRKSNALVLDDEDVASEHCMLISTSNGLMIVDLGSSAGTLLNGETVTRNQVKANSVLKIGNVTLRLVDSQDVNGASKPGRPKAVPQVVEITDLADLDADGDGDAAESEAAPAQKRARRKKASVRSRKKESAKAPGRSDRAKVEDDYELPEIIDDDDTGLGAALQTLKTRAVTEAPGRSGGMSSIVGAGLFVVALLVIGGSSVTIISGLVANKNIDPASENNRVSNWSFEEALGANGQIPGWSLERDSDKSSFKLDELTDTGKKVLLATLAPNSEVKVTSISELDLSLEGVKRVVVRGQFSVDGSAVVGLKVLWRGDGDTKQGESLLALSNEGGVLQLSGHSLPPYGAGSAKLVAFASAGSSAKVTFDRLELYEEDEPGYMSLAREECVVACDRKGVMTLIRPDPGREEIMASRVQVGLVASKDMKLLPYSEQQGARVEVALKKRKRRLRFRGALYDQEDDVWRRLTTSIESTGSGLRFSCNFAGESMPAGRKVFIRFEVPAVRVIEPVTVINAREQNSALAPLFKGKKDAIAVKDVIEMAWGQGARQVSLKFSSAATLIAKRVNKGLQLDFVVTLDDTDEPVERAAWFELVSSSTMVQSRIRGLLKKAQRARGSGDLGEALKIYNRIARDFDFDKSIAAQARNRAQDIRKYAAELAQEISLAVADANRVESPAIEVSATARFKILEAAFPGDGATVEARASLQQIRGRNQKRSLVQQEIRAKQILELGKRYRERRRLALARAAFKLLTDFYPSDFDCVREAKVILERGEED